MRKWAWTVLGAAAILAGGRGTAQQGQSGPEQPTIVVEGRDRDQQINGLVDSLPPAPANGSIARFEHEACPAILGVPPAQRAQVAGRMRAVGAAAGVPMGSATCRPNIVILVTADKRRLIAELERHYPHYLGALSRRQIARLARSPAPSALWHMRGTVDADGRPLVDNEDEFVIQRTTRAGSRLRELAHPEYVGSVLVVEGRALNGLTTTQLADYAAMRTLTGADPARLPDRSVSTILTLLDASGGRDVPIALTSWDLAFLQSLYASDGGHPASSQRSEIQSGMRRALDRPADRRENH